MQYLSEKEISIQVKKGGGVYDRITISGTDHCCTVTVKEDNDRGGECVFKEILKYVIMK